MYQLVASCPLQFGSWFLVLLSENLFPRGEGFYFSIPKLLALIVIYLCWVRTSSWVDQDARQLHLPTVPWNPLMLGCGLVGMLVVWLLPWFWLSFGILIVLYLSPSLAYAAARNQRVAVEERVLNEHHFRKLAARYLRIQTVERRTKKDEGPPVRFIARSMTEAEADQAREARAAEAKGYKNAAALVHQAVKFRASEVQLEPGREEFTVRFCIDGVVQPGDSLRRALGDALISIYKILANMDVAEKRKPQDGSFSAKVDKRHVDFRVSTSGSGAGERLTLTVVDSSQRVTDLAKLGMTTAMQARIRALVAQPQGLLLVCGPEGAGKTTTLYACLNAIDRFTRNVISLENPVDYRLPNVMQCEIGPKTGRTFASELPGILRQDPDVVLIGELTDPESADIACQAAQAGRLVLSAVEASDAVAALFQLIDMGVPPPTVAHGVSAVLAQRLVRLLCPKCKVRYKPNAEALRKTNLPADIKFLFRPPEPGETRTRDPEDADGPSICKHCRGTGYRGRTGVFELLELNEPTREFIAANPNLIAVQQEIGRGGMRRLKEDGLRQVIEGHTFIKEYLRVCQ